MHTHPALHLPWRILVGTVGTVIALVGVVMLVIPGPGIASILLGLVILSTEFRWAHRILRPVRVWARKGEQWFVHAKNDYLAQRRERRAAKTEGRGRSAPPGPAAE